jgi:tRNA dimethylallyltransferase
VLVLTGPTGAGKSAWAMSLAESLPVEIISVDSAQVFRGLDIGTAKPSVAERARVPHHLIDICDPAERFSAGDFVRAARSAIAAIHQRGKVPLLVGGTLLYLRSLWHGIATLPAAAPELRAALDDEAQRIGWSALHARLAGVDPVAAARIHANDAQRIQRALEVHTLTGQPISTLQARITGAEADYRWLRVALVPGDREALRTRLAQRFKAMLDAGLAAEVQVLYQRGDLHAALPAMRSVGYRQLWEWCSGKQTLGRAAELATIATCQLAKRQLTWVRSEPTLALQNADSPNGMQQFEQAVRKFIDSP